VSVQRLPINIGTALDQAYRLERLAEELAQTRDPQQVLDAVTSSGVAAAGARAGMIALLDDEGERLEIVAWRGFDEDTMREWESFELRDDLPLSRAVLRGEPVFIGSRADRDRDFPAFARRGGHSHALVCLPLIVEGGPAFGGLALSFDQEEEFDEERRRFKLALSQQVAQALDRTRLFAAEQQLRRRMSFLAEAGDLLSSSLDYRQTLSKIAQLTVPWLADWCAVDMLSEDRTQLQRLAVAHSDPEMVAWAQKLGDRYAPDLDSPHGVPRVLRSRDPELVREVTDELLVAASEGDRELLSILRRLALRSAIIVPLVARGRAIGAVTMVRSTSEARYTDDDLQLAIELARRAAVAVDNSLLFAETQHQADAGRALDHVAEAVVLVNDVGVVRYWNPMAERLTGLPAEQVLGRSAGAVIPGWTELTGQVSLSEGEGPSAPVVVPFSSPDGDRWCELRAVRFEQGCVYTFRDVTADRELERIRSDFVATTSHELRTPLAAIYGAIRTVRRPDISLPDEQREVFFEMIEREAEHLRVICDQLLTAGQLDAGQLSFSVLPVDVVSLAKEVLAAAEVVAASTAVFRLDADQKPLLALANEAMLRQALANLVDNAVKYSPDGGEIEIRVTHSQQRIQIAVSDHGIGIAQNAQARIFEKFFRADPNLSRGVGGTGLGLYIAKQLTEQMDGRLTLRSTEGAGSTFAIELPATDQIVRALQAPRSSSMSGSSFEL
jgi:PAS domain S-box-containing protein